MAYRIPLQNGCHRGHVTGWSKLMHIAPSIPLLLRSPAVTAGPWTVEVVTFACILITLGGVCLVWTAIKPQYGSFLLGGALVTFGACWLGVVCALRWNREETRAAAIAAATRRINHRTCGDGGETDDEETSMIHLDVDSSNTSSGSAVSVTSEIRLDFQPNVDIRSGNPRPGRALQNMVPSNQNSPRHCGFHPGGNIQSTEIDTTRFLPSAILHPRITLPPPPGSRVMMLPSIVIDTRREQNNRRQSPEGAVQNPHVDDFR